MTVNKRAAKAAAAQVDRRAGKWVHDNRPDLWFQWMKEECEAHGVYTQAESALSIRASYDAGWRTPPKPKRIPESWKDV